MPSTTRRRFRIGLHQKYDRSYESIKSRSGILTQTSGVNFESLSVSDESGCRQMLLRIKGDETGQVRTSTNERVPAELLMAEMRLVEKARLAFGNAYTSKDVEMILNGRKPYPPQMDTDHGTLMHDFWFALANFDCRLEEIDKLEARIKGFEDARRSETILPFGPVGQRSEDGSRQEYIDGQKITDYRIDESLSPYNKMNIATYLLDVVGQWLPQAQRSKNGGWCRIAKDKLPRPPAGIMQ